MIWNCLTKADELKCSSIAFPSLGTGKLWHPFHLVAETMYHTIQCYEQSHSDTNIRNISIVLYEKDQECIQVSNHCLSTKHTDNAMYFLTRKGQSMELLRKRIQQRNHIVTEMHGVKQLFQFASRVLS